MAEKARKLKIQHKTTGDMSEIKNALNVINDAVLHSSEDVTSLIKKDYRNISALLKEDKSEIADSVKSMKESTLEKLNKSKKIITESTVSTAKEIDKKAHNNPWRFIAASSLASGLAGFFAGRKSK